MDERILELAVQAKKDGSTVRGRFVTVSEGRKIEELILVVED